MHGFSIWVCSWGLRVQWLHPAVTCSAQFCFADRYLPAVRYFAALHYVVCRCMVEDELQCHQGMPSTSKSQLASETLTVFELTLTAT